MKPILAAWPQQRRNLAFGPMALGIFLVVFLILGFATNDVFVPLVIGLPAGIAGAWALVGFPVVTRKDGKPLVDPVVKPYLFFPLAFVITVIAYPVLGILLTKVNTPLSLLAIISLVVSLAIGITAAYFLVGFPKMWHHVRDQYARITPERRPWFFFLVFPILFLILYIGLGAASSALLPDEPQRAAKLLDLQILLLLPICLILAALGAYLLMGFPKPANGWKSTVPKVTGKHRPRAFLLTFLLAGLPLTLLAGYLLSLAAPSAGGSKFLPDELQLPLALVLGYCASLGLAAAVWGTSARWRRYDDYTPGLSPRARMGAAGAAGLAVALAIVVGFGLAGIDIFWGMLLGGFLGILVGVIVAGVHRRVLAAARGDAANLPDRLKSLVLFSTWIVLTIVLFSVLAYGLPPDLVGWDLGVSLALGLVIALLIVERSFLQDMIAERRAARIKRKAWERHRKEALAQARGEPASGAGERRA